MQFVRPNPAWTNSALLDHWDDIERLVGPALMPKVTKHTATKLRAVEYGSGVYGTVMPSRTRGMVVKVTSDPTEALFAYIASTMLRKYPAGLVRYGKVVRLHGRHSGRPIYILWREEAKDVGHAIQSRDTRKALEMIRRAADPAFRLTYTKEERDSYARSILEQSKSFRRRTGYERGAGGPGVLRKIRLFVGGGITRAGWGVAAARELADQMSKSKSAPLVGDAIRDLIDQGIVLADVHPGNVGRVRRRGRWQVAITDPGNVGLLTSRFDRVEVPTIQHYDRHKMAAGYR